MHAVSDGALNKDQQCNRAQRSKKGADTPGKEKYKQTPRPHLLRSTPHTIQPRAPPDSTPVGFASREVATG